MKTNKIISVLTILLFFTIYLPQVSFANDAIEVAPAGKLSREVLKTGLEIGTELSHITYEEPGLMKDKGFMYGICGSYTWREDMMLKLEGKYAYGQIDYTSTSTGSMDNLKDTMIELRMLSGYDFPFLDTIYITPYTGFGYRYLNDDSSGMTTSTGALGYNRESNYLYTPLGIELSMPPTNDLTVSFIFEYDVFMWGMQKSYLSSANSNYNDIENRQREGYGIRSSLPILMKTENLYIVLEPYVRYWNIEKSDSDTVTYAGIAVGYGYEPKNTSTEWGLKLAVSF